MGTLARVTEVTQVPAAAGEEQVSAHPLGAGGVASHAAVPTVLKNNFIEI